MSFGFKDDPFRQDRQDRHFWMDLVGPGGVLIRFGLSIFRLAAAEGKEFLGVVPSYVLGLRPLD